MKRGLDFEKYVRRSNLTHQGGITFGPHGMPVGNGRFGGPIWQENEQTLSMQLNHTDLFMYADSSANSEGQSGGMGKLTVDFATPVFTECAEQELDLYHGIWKFRNGPAASADLKIQIVADSERNAILIHVEDKRQDKEPASVQLHMLREPVVEKNLFRAVSDLAVAEDQQTMTLHQVFTEPCDTGISENDYYNASALSVRMLERKADEYTIVIGGAVSMDPMVDVLAEAQTAANSVVSFEQTAQETEHKWEAFWSKSYVELPGNAHLEQCWVYYLYLSNISNHGNFPSKYNGGIWIAEGDRRDWGNYYWNWNQDSLYQPFNGANHPELMEPFYRMREKCLPRYKTAARQIWGIDSPDAYFIAETCGVQGAEIMPKEISDDLISYYEGTGELTDRLKAFGLNRNWFLTPWNFAVFNQFTPVSFVSHTMTATQENAEYFWQKYCYTKDTEWLRDHAWPFIKGAAELYRNYSGFYKEEDGKYHFHKTNLHEHIWGGKDIIDDLSFARGIFTVAIQASEILQTDENLRTLWQECLENLTGYPLSTEEDTISHLGVGPQEECILGLGRMPAHTIRGFATETPQFKMLEKYELLNMETRDQGLDGGLWDLAMATYYQTPGYRDQVQGDYVDQNGSSRFLEDIAKLGLAEDFKAAINNQYRMFADTPNRLFDQGDYYSAEGYGTFSQAFQQALMQSIAPTPTADPVIRVFPAWPKEWDARFKLLAKDGFVVSAERIAGTITYVTIESQLGGTCRLRSPWSGTIKVSRCGQNDGTETLSVKQNELLEIKTAVGETLSIHQ